MKLFWKRTDLGLNGQRSRSQVSKFILHTRTLHIRTAIYQHSLGGVTSRRRGLELGIECLLVCRRRNVAVLLVILSKVRFRLGLKHIIEGDRVAGVSF